MVANSIIGDEKKRAVLLLVISAATYKTLRNLVSPTKPGEMSYSQLVEALMKHYKPASSEIVERYKFHSRIRKASELIATFVAELRSLAKFCNFGATLKVMLRGRIVCSINVDTIQKRLLGTQPGLREGCRDCDKKIWRQPPEVSGTSGPSQRGP